jgi:hypothetical protein
VSDNDKISETIENYYFYKGGKNLLFWATLKLGLYDEFSDNYNWVMALQVTK